MYLVERHIGQAEDVDGSITRLAMRTEQALRESEERVRELEEENQELKNRLEK